MSNDPFGDPFSDPFAATSPSSPKSPSLKGDKASGDPFGGGGAGDIFGIGGPDDLFAPTAAAPAATSEGKKSVPSDNDFFGFSESPKKPELEQKQPVASPAPAPEPEPEPEPEAEAETKAGAEAEEEDQVAEELPKQEKRSSADKRSSVADKNVKNGFHDSIEPNGDIYSGEWKDGKMHGKGLLEYSKTGNKFDGEFVHGKRSKGTMTYASGNIYVGDWQNDKYHGNGSLSSELGEYAGGFAQDKFDGEGKLTYPTGDREYYDGGWKKGKRQGAGVLKFRSGPYLMFGGTFTDDAMADGKLEYRDSGDVYTGAFKKSKRHGQGIMTYGEKDECGTFEGTWVEGVRKKGTLVYKNGDKFEGDFDKSDNLAKGKFFYHNGDSYDGAFVEGKHHGKGVYVKAGAEDGESVTITADFSHGEVNKAEVKFPDGGVYTGSVAADDLSQPDGDGKFKRSSGDVCTGTFSSGAFVKGELKAKDGSTYTGAFADDRPHGPGGIKTFSDGSRFEGAFEEGYQRQGVLVAKNGDKYEGSFDDDGQRTGNASFCTSTFSFQGEFSGGLPVTGQIQYTDQFKVVAQERSRRQEYAGGVNGQFQPEKQGDLKWSNGDSYVGSFSDGVVSGQGCLTMLQGEEGQGGQHVYTGLFDNCQLKEGSVEYGGSGPGGAVHYTGSLDSQHQHDGQGEAKYSDGSHFTGTWAQGVFTEGSFTHANGTVLNGLFNKSGRVYHSGVFTFPNGTEHDNTEGSEASFGCYVDNMLNSLALESQGVEAVAETDCLNLGIWPALPELSTEPRLPSALSAHLDSIQGNGGADMLSKLCADRQSLVATLSSTHQQVCSVLEEEAANDTSRRQRFQDRWTVDESSSFTGEYHAKLQSQLTTVEGAQAALQADEADKDAALPGLGILATTGEEHEATIRQAEQDDSNRQELAALLAQQQDNIQARSKLTQEINERAKQLDVMSALLEGGGAVPVEEVFSAEVEPLKQLQEAITESVSAHKALLLDIKRTHSTYSQALDTVKAHALEQVATPLSAAVASFNKVAEKYTSAIVALTAHKDNSFNPLKSQVDTFVKDRAAQRDKLASSLLLADLHAAVLKDDFDTIKALHKEDNVDLDAPGNEEHTALTLAIARGQSEMVKFLLEQGASASKRDHNDHTCLWVAIEEKQDMLLPVLIDGGADPNRSEDQASGETVLHILAKANKLDTITLLVKHKANVNLTCNEGRTPLLCAASGGAENTVKYLISQGAHPNATDKQGNNCFHVSDQDLHAFLAEHGARPGAANSSKQKGGNAAALKAATAAWKKAAAKTASFTEMKEGDAGWTANDASPACVPCGSKFSMFNRRHHCRKCGVLACGSCTGKKAGKLRVCDGCFNAL
mmetsp:Transcript_9524/g.18052  ORF Transcript_9524/g.18052 Transcript_9524/m.18052 type:complete len:1363 (+) Transcript_9524:31-4119(+)